MCSGALISAQCKPEHLEALNVGISRTHLPNLHSLCIKVWGGNSTSFHFCPQYFGDTIYASGLLFQGGMVELLCAVLPPPQPLHGTPATSIQVLAAPETWNICFAPQPFLGWNTYFLKGFIGVTGICKVPSGVEDTCKIKLVAAWVVAPPKECSICWEKSLKFMSFDKTTSPYLLQKLPLSHHGNSSGTQQNSSMGL